MDHNESCVPPGFRFHPTEEELVGFYLKNKVNSLKFDLDVIIDIDLYRIEPWDIQGISLLYTPSLPLHLEATYTQYLILYL